MKRFLYFATVHDPTNKLLGALLEAPGVKGIVGGERDWLFFQDAPASPGSLTDFFAKDDIGVQIFHFAGHAFEQNLQFNGDLDLEATCLVFPDGLAKILSKAKSMQLVFLNGCSTAKQVQHFRDKGIPAVIATHKPLKDEYGYEFAKKFYHAFFKREETLGQAFQSALDELEFEKGNFTNDWVNQDLAAAADRGALVLDHNPAKPVYELFAANDFKQKKLSEWALPASPAAAVGASKNRGMLIPETQVLLCNRSKEARELEKILEQQLLTPPPNRPILFFINDLKSAAPHDLYRRFDLHDVNSFRKKKQLSGDWLEWHTNIDLPKSDHWKDGVACLSRLQEIYDELLKSEPAAGVAGKSNRLLVVHHNLNFLQIRWRQEDQIEGLFGTYCQEFSQFLERDFGGRVAAVLFVVEYFDKKSGFHEHFKKLAAQHDHVVNLTEMSGISIEDVNDWLHLIFEGDPKLDPEVIFPKETPEITMAQALGILKEALEEYNLKGN